VIKVLNDCLLSLEKTSINNQGPYRAAIVINAAEPELLQKAEFSLKNAIFVTASNVLRT
jgi:hypothetical protein